MQLSTRGRYAVMSLLDLATLQEMRGGLKPVRLSEIAERQDISLSYLEQLFAQMRRKKIVKSVRGPGGGYLLVKPASETWLGDIINSVDEKINVTRCGAMGSKGGKGCMKDGKNCNSHCLWEALGGHIEGFMRRVSLDMVLTGEVIDVGMSIEKELG